MNNNVECYGFRCNLAIKDITLYNVNLPDTKESRNQLFKNFFTNLKEKKILETSYQKRKYLLIYKEEADDIIHCQIAREREISINEFNNGDIIEKKKDDYPYVNIFFDLLGQKIIIEINTYVFENVDTCKKVIKNIMGNYFKKNDIIIDIYPITEKNDFNSCFENGKVNHVSFEMSVPNWGNAASAAKELAEDSKKMGAEKIVYTLTNKDGNIIYNEDMKTFVEYISDGAGVWKIKGTDENGNKYSVQSEEKKKKIPMNTSKDRINKKLDEAQILIIKEAFNKIETIEGLKMNYESE